MKKLHIFLLAVLCLILNLFLIKAQNSGFCDTKSATPNFLNQLTNDQLDDTPSNISVRLVFHLMNDNGEGDEDTPPINIGRVEEDVLEAINIINADFNPHGIYFDEYCINEVHDFSSVSRAMAIGCDNDPSCPFLRYSLEENAINIFVMFEQNYLQTSCTPKMGILLEALPWELVVMP